MIRRKRRWPMHRKFIESQPCVVPGCSRPSVCAHLRTAGNSGIGLKPHDQFTVPLCDTHHKELDTPAPRDCIDGESRTYRFLRKYGVDLWKIAADLAERSPDLAMRATMQEVLKK
jgi:hypothetical protein